MNVRHITSSLWTIVSTSLSRAVLRHYHFWSERDCLWPYEILNFSQRSLNYKPRALSNLCVHVIVKSHFIHELYILQRFQTTKVTFKLTQGHQQWCHSIAHIWFLICLPLWLSLSYTVSEKLSLISQNLKTLCDHDHAHSKYSFYSQC